MPRLPTAPAPWFLKGQAFCFVHGTRQASPVPDHNEDPTTGSRPLVGGLGGILLFRYATSPVGPYDELIIVPGAYGHQQLKQPPLSFSSFGSLSQLALRLLSRKPLASTPIGHHTQLSERSFGISQIFVSTEASTKNGRQNWSIPKKQATFDWQQDPKTGEAHVSVSLPASHNQHILAASQDEHQVPFLKASFKSLTPHVWMPKVVVPAIFRRILQPALPEQAPLFHGDAKSDASELLVQHQHIAQNRSKFVSTKLDVDAHIGVCELTHLWTDGIQVPACDAMEPFKLGCSLKKVNLTFNVPDVYWLASVFGQKSAKSA